MIDQLASTSADQLRAGTTGDVEAGLADLHVRQAQHRRRTGVAAACSLVIAVGLGVVAGNVLARSDDAGPAPTHRPTPAPPAGSHEAICASPRVTCRADGSYGFALERPVVWALPPGFGADSGGGATSLQVESYRDVGTSAGVTVLEQARASSPRGKGAAPGVADGPKAFVDWVAGRPYLDASRVSRTTLDGRPAWRVRVVLAPDAGGGEAICNGNLCHALTYQADGETTGIWGDMAAEYTALRLPGGGTTVVWSWIFTGNPAHLGALEEAVHGVSWPDD